MIFLLACAEPDVPPAPAVPAVEAFRQVVPSDGLPPEVVDQPANNNLDITWHDGRLFLAFRTAPNHFASADVVMVVVSTTDESTWRFEGQIALGTDVREPQLVSFGGELSLWIAVLGSNPLEFEPQGAERRRYLGPGEWTDPEPWPDPGFIPWRIKELDGRLHLVGYTGGENIYDADGEPLHVHWLASDDGETWAPAAGGDGIVLTGGTSETDFVRLDDGALVAVSRNEAGEAVDGFGSKICRAEADDLGTWTCRADPRKFDSPLMFRKGDGIWLVARRNVTEDGAFDLGYDDLSLQQRFLLYSTAYWNEPKRCTLWSVDPESLDVVRVLDLPSRGDTCFPEAIDGPDGVLLYNYSSDPEGPDYTWVEGQFQPTNLYRMLLTGL